uniref:Hexosyltransferase n=1 Tax=Aureoumbra lagunensis TaxID=44058 RepID=A0A7S3JPU4_9STRA|mmetsp:Transcript_8350/g.12731  ORF Transcript_8350/g.12731 Transcript_8350/m.12731 type:complete len:460 (-) Transcript_8350:231-1610(-)|eukprot:CAMPEP_0197316694 /NCGR_PEP_ID=MMETSP0891-20130614/43723_1 /TAXON_ID=44058 ORGANISM="Aureoumbra lagunensis, Strain CCMP1510" /NCGR_SAMPLE_ID=MMETSP0891 /ASSEMBLY_ACC=CAM_ASM_000534 /LENGTH=459 /DNA_ID=CAMNT_0042806297 /DNA_START=44 /DNA_END=1423 /DNA_ORIENTATION=-
MIGTTASSASMRRGRKPPVAVNRLTYEDEKSGSSSLSTPRRWLIQLVVIIGLILGLRLFILSGRAALVRQRAQQLRNSIDLHHLVMMKDNGASKSCNDAFVTIVLPSVVNPRGRDTRLKAIAATWGSDSRAVFVSHEDNVEVKEEDWIPLNGKSICDSITWPRRLIVPSSINPATMGVARYFWVLQALGNLTDTIKFAFFVNDHTAVISSNLKCFLRSLSSEIPLYLGHSLANRGGGKDIFNSGAAGYVLSKASIQLLLRLVHEQHPSCIAAKSNKWLQGNPGLVVARCLASSGVIPLDTREEHNSGGRHRFHAYGPVRTATAAVDDWYTRMHDSLLVNPPANVAPAPNCCAKRTISFHYVEAHEQCTIHTILQDAVPRFRATVPSNIDTIAWLRTNWPSPAKLGGYSLQFPQEPKPASQVEHLLFHHLQMAGPSDICDDHVSWRLLLHRHNNNNTQRL